MHLITEFQRMKDDIHILLSFSASRESRHYFPAIIFPPKHIMGGGGEVEGGGGPQQSSLGHNKDYMSERGSLQYGDFRTAM